jgi:hypothetical protein
MFSGALSEKRLARMGKIYMGKPLKTKTRKELLATLKPSQWQYLRADTGDMPDGYTAMPEAMSSERTVSITA